MSLVEPNLGVLEGRTPSKKLALQSKIFELLNIESWNSM